MGNSSLRREIVYETGNTARAIQLKWGKGFCRRSALMNADQGVMSGALRISTLIADSESQTLE
jgi:hypothetical protein